MNDRVDRSRRSRAVAVIRWIGGPLLLGGAALTVCWATGCMERLFYHPVSEPTPLPPEFPAAERVEFASTGGTRLVGWFLPARNSDGTRPPPTILHSHGNAGNLNSHWWFTGYLPDAGFNVFIFDYRGYGESEGRATRRGPLIDDAEAALDVLLRRDDVDPRRIGLYGQSLGGSIGAVLLGRREEIRAAVLESPFTSWRRIAANAVGGDPPHAPARGLARLLISDDMRPIDALARTSTPVLVLHGTHDRTIPISHAREIAALGRANIEVIELEGGDHNSLRSTHPEVETLVIEFFRRELGGKPTQADDPANDPADDCR